MSNNFSKKLDKLEKKMDQSFEMLQEKVNDNSQDKNEKVEALKCRKNDE